MKFVVWSIAAVLVIAGVGSFLTSDDDEAAPPPVAAKQLFAPTSSTEPTRNPDRHDCTAIQGTEYRSDTERSWFGVGYGALARQ
jgi:hypothetical protein